METKLTIGNYNLLKKIGEGAFSKVYRAETLSGAQNDRIAIKVQSHQNNSRCLVKETFDNEIFIHSQLSHPHIVKYIEASAKAVMKKTETGEERLRAFIATEWCSNGDLFDKILNCEGFSERLAKHYFRQMVDAIEYMHK